MKTLLYAAFCGSGKTYTCENTDIKAIEIEYWKYKDSSKEKYLKDIEENIGKVDYIFISTDPEGLKLLSNKGYDITLVYPKKELRNEYLDRYINRDSSADFIGNFMKYWDVWIDELANQDYCNHIVLNKNQYLYDYLI